MPLLVLLAALALAACGAGEAVGSRAETASDPQTEAGSGDTSEEGGREVETILLSVNGTSFSAALEDNVATISLLAMLASGPVTVELSDYGGFEKVGALGTPLPTENSQVTTQAGDVVLYQENQIVCFYGSNAWSYTRLAHVDDSAGWSEALGGGDVTLVISLPE